MAGGLNRRRRLGTMEGLKSNAQGVVYSPYANPQSPIPNP